VTKKVPKVSVIIPTYNRAHLVGRAIRSVLNQTYQDFEIIVVDDHSTDNTEEVVKSFNDPRIRYIRHEKNRGGSAARNTGIRAARGEYIAFLDDDDYWLPTKVEKQISLFEQAPADVGMVYSGFALVNPSCSRIYGLHKPRCRGRLSAKEIFSWITTTSTMMVRKDFLIQIGGFDERLSVFEDPDLRIRLAQICRFDYIDEVQVLYGPQGNPCPEVVSKASTHFLDKHKHLINELSPEQKRI